MKINYLITLLLITLLSNSWAQEQPILALKDSVIKVMEEKHIPGIFITVVNKDSVLWQAAIGEANVATKEKLTPNHVFKIGSVSKTFTALAVMKLVKEGRLSLNDELRKIAPEIPFTNKWSKTHPVKIKHLLEHEAGFDDMHIAAFVKDRPDGMTALEEVMNHKNSLESRWEPGLAYAYSNPGYMILGYLIEKISGQAYQKYIRDNVILPLNMTETYFTSQKKQHTNIPVALGYSWQNDTAKLAKDVKIIGEAAGALLSNAVDMSKFAQYFLNTTQQDSITLLSSEEVGKMEKNHGWFETKNRVEGGYHLGLYNRELGEAKHRFLGHDGGINGFVSAFVYSRELDLGIVLSNNGEKGNSKILDLIVDAFAPKTTEDTLKTVSKNKAKIDLMPFKKWEGEYQVFTSRNKLFDFLNFPFRTCKLKIEDDSLTIKNFLSDKNAYHLVEKKAFKQQKENYPSVYLAEQDGQRYLSYEQDMLKPINSLKMLLFRVLFALSGLMGILAIIATIVTLLLAPFKKAWRAPLWRNFIFTLPFALIMGSIAIIATSSSMDAIERMGKFSMSSVSIFLLTTLPPIACLLAAYFLFKYWKNNTKKWGKAFYISLFLGGVFLVGYCILQNWFAVQLWSY